jgi:acyl-coenzyme A thioesterase PaaI-like protein
LSAELPEDASGVWLVADPPEEGGRRAKHDLAEVTRRLVESVALLDVTELDAADVEALAAGVRDLANRIDALPSLRRHGSAATAPYPDGALTERSGISGRSNPLAPPLRLRVEGERTVAAAVYGEAYEGPPGCLHGGFVAAAFDDLLGCAQMASGTAGFTGTPTIKMRKPTPLNTRIDYEAGVTRVSGRRIVCWGRSTADGQLLAEAEGIFITPPEGSLPVKREPVPLDEAD